MIELLYKGGVCMIPLSLCSLLALAIIMERFYGLRREKVISSEIVHLAENIEAEGDKNLAISICDNIKTPFANLIKSILVNHRLSKEENYETLKVLSRQEANRLTRGLGTLEIISVISPLLGLLGTVLGMVKVFQVVSQEEIGGRMASLSVGISEALITTIFGLIIAIPAVVSHSYFTQKVDDYLLDMEKHCTFLLSKLYRKSFADRID